MTADADGTATDVRLDPLSAAAEEHGLTVLTGAAVRRPGGALTNSVLAAGPSGAVAGVYDKQHLWHDDEAALFTPGGGGTAVYGPDGTALGRSGNRRESTLLARLDSEGITRVRAFLHMLDEHRAAVAGPPEGS